MDAKIKNGTGKRMAFKVKCSDNDLFKIRPVMGVLKDGEDAKVTLTFTAKDKKAPKDPHHFSLYEFEAKDEKKAARKLWEDAEAKKKKRHKKVKVAFKDEGGEEEKKDDKKEDEKKDEKKEDKKDEDKKEEKKEDDKKEEKKDEEKKDDKKEDEKKEDDKKDEKKEDEKKEEDKKEEKKE